MNKDNQHGFSAINLTQTIIIYIFSISNLDVWLVDLLACQLLFVFIKTLYHEQNATQDQCLSRVQLV